MSKFSESKSSERSNASSDDGVDNQADFKSVRELWRINTSDTAQTTQYSGIQDLLAYDNDDQHPKVLSLTQELTPPEGGLPPGTFAPQNSILEEVPTPTVPTVQQAAEDLELIAQMVFDRISLRLNPEMERRGFHQSNRIFSHHASAIHQKDSVQITLSCSSALEKLAQEIEQLFHHRLVHERERQGRFGGGFPW